MLIFLRYLREYYMPGGLEYELKLSKKILYRFYIVCIYNYGKLKNKNKFITFKSSFQELLLI